METADTESTMRPLERATFQQVDTIFRYNTISPVMNKGLFSTLKRDFNPTLSPKSLLLYVILEVKGQWLILVIHVVCFATNR